MIETTKPSGDPYRRSLACFAAVALVATTLASVALAEAGLTRTVGSWTVACEKTEAGGGACELRNDEAGKPALEQSKLLALTLHAGSNQTEGMVRITGLELPPRLGVEIAFGDRKLAVEGVGRHGRLAARFTLPRSELAGLANADRVRVRFADQQAEAHEVIFPTDGLAAALDLADDQL